MKTYDEMYQSVLSKYDKYLEKKKKRNRIIRRTVPVLACLCLTIVFGIGYWDNLKNLPHNPEQTGIIEETTIETPDTTTATTVTNNNTTIQTNAHTALVTTTVSIKNTVSDRVTSTETKHTQTVTSVVSETESSIKTESHANKPTETQAPSTTQPHTSPPVVTTNETHTSTVTETQPVNNDSRLLYPVEKQISIERYKAMGAASYIIYNDLEASVTTTDITGTTQTTTVPLETTTTTVTPDETQMALDKLTQKENRLFGEFQRERAVLLGELSPDAPRLTLDEAVEIIESSGSFAEICRKLHEAQPLVDYIGGSGITRLEYWFDDKGAQKIYLIMEEESIFYFHFTGADMVYS